MKKFDIVTYQIEPNTKAKQHWKNTIKIRPMLNLFTAGFYIKMPGLLASGV